MSHIEISPALLETLRDLIIQARQQALRSVDVIHVQTYWHIGRHIVEFEQDGQTRAVYGKRLLSTLAEVLTREFGKGFGAGACTIAVNIAIAQIELEPIHPISHDKANHD